ncbi:MAG TPA: DNA translocase FtsK, partial [Gaiellaceae bacterium]|nr:DNA translocase FtsK [Gaiellaceae bacterium]
MAQARRSTRTAKPRAKAPARSRARARKRARRKHHDAEFVGLGLLGVGVFLACVLWFGLSGGLVPHAAFRVIGWAAYISPAVFCPLGALIVTRSALVAVRPFRLGLSVTLAGLMLALGTTHGGWVGRQFETLVAKGVGSTGSTILGILATLVGVLFLTGASLGALVRRSGNAVREASTRVRQERAARPSRPVAEPAHELISFHPLEKVEAPVDAVQDYPDIVSTTPPTLLPELGFGSDDPTEDTQTALFATDATPPPAYRLPDRSVLKKSAPGTGPNAAANRRTAEALLECLASFGVEATVIGMISGPRVTRYELQLAPGTKVGKVAQLRDDLSYALATTEIRILAPIPGKQAVGVEVPNLSPNLVTLGDIYGDIPPQSSPLAVWIGKGIDGIPVYCDLARMPHLLIAGTTGSGKSGCINAILTSILLRSSPDQVRMILIDPKRIELNHYESIPHLLTPVVSSPKEASAVLLNVVTEMERRYERLAQVRARG